MPEPGRDVGFSLALILVGIVVLIEVENIPPPMFETFGAAPVPRVSAMLLIGGAVIMLVRSAISLAGSRQASPRLGWLIPDHRLAGTVVIMVAHAAAISFLGLSFLAATIPALFLMFLLLDQVTLQRVAVAATLAVTIAGGLFLVFTRVFHTDLP